MTSDEATEEILRDHYRARYPKGSIVQVKTIPQADGWVGAPREWSLARVRGWDLVPGAPLYPVRCFVERLDGGRPFEWDPFFGPEEVRAGDEEAA